MKSPRFIAFALLTLALAARLPAGTAIDADSHITAVTVYPDRAVITRTAEIDVAAPGALELSFASLPDALLDESLQASGAGTAAATLLELAARPVFVDTAPDARAKSLEDEIRSVDQQDRTLADRATILGQQRDYVLHIQTATTTPARDAASAATTPPDVWTRLLAFSEEQLEKIAAEVRSIDTQRTDLKARRTALEQQLEQLRGAGRRATKTVAARLAAASAGHLTFTLRYTVIGASWTPTYDVRARSDERQAHLAYSGLVRQNTGEDWSGVALTLSTARPALGGAAPELDPWIVQERPRPVPKAAQTDETIVLSPFAITAANDKGYRAKATPAGTRAQMNEIASGTAALSTQATSASFRIPDTVDVPADNTAHKLGITTITLQTEPAYRAVPKLIPSAFLSARVTNTSDYPLLAGAMNVFLDDTFVAAADLPSVMPGEKFDLALGADEGVAVKRKLNHRLVEETGLVNKGRRITYDYTLSVQNNKRTAVHLVLLDQIAVSRHEKIVVKQLAPDARDLKPDADGTLTWTLDLKPGEKRELPLKFSIEHPNDLPVVGVE